MWDAYVTLNRDFSRAKFNDFAEYIYIHIYTCAFIVVFLLRYYSVHVVVVVVVYRNCSLKKYRIKKNPGRNKQKQIIIINACEMIS